MVYALDVYKTFFDMSKKNSLEKFNLISQKALHGYKRL